MAVNGYSLLTTDHSLTTDLHIIPSTVNNNEHTPHTDGYKLTSGFAGRKRRGTALMQPWERRAETIEQRKIRHEAEDSEAVENLENFNAEKVSPPYSPLLHTHFLSLPLTSSPLNFHTSTYSPLHFLIPTSSPHNSLTPTFTLHLSFKPTSCPLHSFTLISSPLPYVPSPPQISLQANGIDQFIMSGDLQTMVASYYAHHLCVFDISSSTHVATLESSCTMLMLYVSAISHDGTSLVHANYDEQVKVTEPPHTPPHTPCHSHHYLIHHSLLHLTHYPAHTTPSHNTPHKLHSLHLPRALHSLHLTHHSLTHYPSYTV